MPVCSSSFPGNCLKHKIKYKTRAPLSSSGVLVLKKSISIFLSKNRCECLAIEDPRLWNGWIHHSVGLNPESMLWRGIVFITYKTPILSFSYWLALIFSLLNTCVMYFPRCLIFPLLFKGSLCTSYTLIPCTQRVNELKLMVSKGIKVLLGNQVRDLWDRFISSSFLSVHVTEFGISVYLVYPKHPQPTDFPQNRNLIY